MAVRKAHLYICKRRPMIMDIEKLRILCNNKRLIITQHCIKRMMERSIELTEIKQAIAEGEVIEDYPDDYPYPSCLPWRLVSSRRTCMPCAWSKAA